MVHPRVRLGRSSMSRAWQRQSRASTRRRFLSEGTTLFFVRTRSMGKLCAGREAKRLVPQAKSSSAIVFLRGARRASAHPREKPRARQSERERNGPARVQAVGVDETRTSRISPRRAATRTSTRAACSTHASDTSGSSRASISIVSIDDSCIVGSAIAAIESFEKAEIAGIGNWAVASIRIGARVEAAVSRAGSALADPGDP